MDSDTEMKLRTSVTKWRELARKAVAGKVASAEEVRSLASALLAMRKRAEQLEQDRDNVSAVAEELVAQRDEQLRRFRGWCDRWLRGDVGANIVIAGLTAELNGDVMEEPTVFERRQAVQNAEIVSLMNEATDQLAAIEHALAEEGFELTSSHSVLVRDYIRHMKNRQEQ